MRRGYRCETAACRHRRRTLRGTPGNKAWRPPLPRPSPATACEERTSPKHACVASSGCKFASRGDPYVGESQVTIKRLAKPSVRSHRRLRGRAMVLLHSLSDGACVFHNKMEAVSHVT